MSTKRSAPVAVTSSVAVCALLVLVLPPGCSHLSSDMLTCSRERRRTDRSPQPPGKRRGRPVELPSLQTAGVLASTYNEKNAAPPSELSALAFNLPPTLADQSDAGEKREPPADETTSPEDQPGLFKALPGARDKFWYLDFGMRAGHTRLESTNDQINKRIELPLKLDAFGMFNSPHTPLDRKTDGLLTTSYAGIGRRETNWLTWNFYIGAGVGGDHNHQRRFNANLNVNFDYASYFTGLTADIYPWGLPDYRKFDGWIDRFLASRPYLLTGLEFGYIRAKGWGNFKLAPLTLYADEVKIRDFLFSYLAGLGWELPLNEKWSFNWSGYYAFHIYRPEEYNGWNLVFAFRYRF